MTNSARRFQRLLKRYQIVSESVTFRRPRWYNQHKPHPVAGGGSTKQVVRQGSALAGRRAIPSWVIPKRRQHCQAEVPCPHNGCCSDKTGVMRRLLAVGAAATSHPPLREEQRERRRRSQPASCLLFPFTAKPNNWQSPERDGQKTEGVHPRR